MTKETGPRLIPLDEVLQVSSTRCVELQDENHEPLDGLYFSDDQAAVRYLWSAANSDNPVPLTKIDIPLELPMSGAFRLEDPETSDRPSKDFRIVMPDRVVAPDNDESCTVMPYYLHNGITTLNLDLAKSGNRHITSLLKFHLNIHEPDMPHPISKSTEPILQVIVYPELATSDNVFDKYEAHKREAGRIIQRIVNTPVFE